MHLDYVVTYKDFLASMKAFRRRAPAAACVYYLELCFLPAIGLFLILLYFYFYFTEGSQGTDGIGYAPWVGSLFMVMGPLTRRWRMRQLYKQRMVLAIDGSISAELDDTTVRFIIQDKLDLKYSWDAFSDYAENDDVITLFVQKSAFHTIPRRGMSDAQWTEFMQLVTSHVRKR